MRCCEADECLESSCSDCKPWLFARLWIASICHAALEPHSHVDILLGHHSLGFLSEHRREAPAESDVLAKKVYCEDLGRLFAVWTWELTLKDFGGLLRPLHVRFLTTLQNIGMHLLNTATSIC